MKIEFTMTDGTYTYTDALHLDDDHGLTELDIENLKQQRFNNWLEIILNPVDPPIDEPLDIPVEQTVEITNGD